MGEDMKKDILVISLGTAFMILAPLLAALWKENIPARAQPATQMRTAPIVNGGQGSISCNVTSGLLLAANPNRARLLIQNNSPTASIAIADNSVQGSCNGTASVNMSCSITLGPLGSISLDQTRWTNQINCISSAGPSQVTTMEW
jgi:hypothetical protein